jgi:class 3 adenylate cyclase
VNPKMNKTSISSVVCFDIIDFAKKSEAEQQLAKKQFNALIDIAVVDIPENDRLIVDTGHGAVVTCSGSLENALEDALFIALTVRDEALNNNANSESPLYLLIGINLGSVKLAKSTNVNDGPKIIGEGLIEAQRIMSFANPNQILVSRAYYDMASKLTLEIAQMFEKYDMHAYEHDIYAVRLLNEKAGIAESAAVIPEQIEVLEDSKNTRPINWSAFVLPIILAFTIFYVFNKWMQQPNQPVITMQPATKDEVTPEIGDVWSTEEVDQGSIDTSDSASKTENNAQKISKQPTVENKTSIKKKTTPKPASPKETTKSKPVESVVTEDKTAVDAPVAASTNQEDEKSGWESFKDNIKQGAPRECTQAEKALNQCN